jgi:transcriptional regulator with XRE-family HTH domain
MSQAALANLVGVGRHWVIRTEQGNSSTEVGLLLRALNAVGLRVDISSGGEKSTVRLDAIDIDAILDRNRRRHA